MTSGIAGSDYEPHPVTADRLVMWRRLASIGTPRRQIADQLGISVITLDRLVGRARRARHPDAIRHPGAAEPGIGFYRISRGRHHAAR